MMKFRFAMYVLMVTPELVSHTVFPAALTDENSFLLRVPKKFKIAS